jgi:hypothetical protein
MKYEIRNASGQLVAVHVREDLADEKIFRWERPDGQGGLDGTPCASLPLYGSHLVSDWNAAAPIIIVEGEKAADALLSRNFKALATVTGAGAKDAPCRDSIEVLRNREIILWPDNDDIGRAHMAKLTTAIDGVASSVRRLEWGQQKGDDAFDFFARGGTEEQLDRMLAEAPNAVSIPGDWIRPGDGLASRRAPTARVKTGIPTLDEATGGGIPTGCPVVITGAPDSGKTGFGQCVADRAERDGFVVIHMTNDNGREGPEVRWGQIMGFDRTKLEEGDPVELALFRAAFANRDIYLPDPDLVDADLRPVNTLKDVIDRGFALWPDRHVLLLPDSIQAIRPDDGDYSGRPRERIAETLRQVRRATNAGWIVLGPSRTNRASRRHKDDAENTDPMTAALESGEIEHVFDLLLHLDGDADSEKGVRVRITKNKPGAGAKPELRMRWNKARAAFSELDRVEVADFEAREARRKESILREAVLTVVRQDPGLATSRVCKKVKGRDSEIVDTLEKLKAERLVRSESVGNGSFWYLVSTLPDEAVS